MKLVGSREFNQDISRAKRDAAAEPVFVTDRGRPTHVLMSIAAYGRLTGQTESIVDLLAMPDGDDIELDFAPSVRAWDYR